MIDEIDHDGVGGFPTIVIAFKQDGKVVGDVSTREFLNSPEVQSAGTTMLIKEAVEYFNSLEDNKAYNLTAHVTVMLK